MFMLHNLSTLRRPMANGHNGEQFAQIIVESMKIQANTVN